MKLELLTSAEIARLDPLELAAMIVVTGPEQELAEAVVVENLSFNIGFWRHETKSFLDVELDRDPKYTKPWALAVWDMLPEEKQIAIQDKLERVKAKQHMEGDV